MAEEIPEFETPDYLKLTKERLQENEARQKVWQKRANPTSFDPNIHERARAARIEKDATEVLKILGGQFDSASDEVKGQILDAHRRERARLAEALATQGRFDEAAHVEPNELKTAHYQKLHDAVTKSDKDWCDCPRIERVGTGTVDNRQNLGNVFSIKHGREMTLVVCRKCLFYNVRELPRGMTPARETHKRR